MKKHNSCIYLVPSFPVFNEQETQQFSSFNKSDSAQLFSALYLNYKEISSQLSELAESIFCFDERDKNHISPEFSGSSKIFINLENKSLLLKLLSEKYFERFNNNLIIFTNTIKISDKDILKYLDLLNREDESFIIGKSQQGKVSFFGFNIYNSDLLNQVEATDLKFDNFLHLVCRYDYFLNVLNGSFYVEDINGFQNLYKELSKKESLNYCSQHMHEKFTHLFIEYKELLKC
ncbi:MAG: hypothetical protein EHM47_06525 [Ignavibacteriales bacterium]|nr:MAG: hypothetical protein EHM47_06525 [Ignavibacteriales bacterium]